MFKNGWQFLRIVCYLRLTNYLILLSIQRNILFIYENQKVYKGTLLATKSSTSLFFYKKGYWSLVEFGRLIAEQMKIWFVMGKELYVGKVLDGNNWGRI
jgi:hypothetical protein